MASDQSEPSPCSTTPNMETTNPTPTSNTDANVDSCGTPHGTEDEGDTLVLGKEFGCIIIMRSLVAYQRLFANIVRKNLEVPQRMGQSI